MIYKSMLKESIVEMERALEQAKAELDTCGPGTMWVIRENGKTCYHYVRKVDGLSSAKRCVIKEGSEKFRRMMRKQLETSKIKILERNIRALKKAENMYVDPVLNEFVSGMPERFACMPVEWFADSESACGWSNKPFLQSTYRVSDKIYTTSRGLKVRSKSEVFIAEQFYNYEVEFHYEQVLAFADDYREYSPDFTIRRKSDGKIFYWEHFGLIDEEKYRSNSLEKLRSYMDHGIIPCDNLIMTFESKNNPLDPQKVIFEIESRLLS